jgi:hypothetical protein
MASSVHTHLDGEERDLPHYSSFILRCWIDRGKQVRARLIEVRSGVSHPLAALNELPELVHQLMAEAPPSVLHEDTKKP